MCRVGNEAMLSSSCLLAFFLTVTESVFVSWPVTLCIHWSSSCLGFAVQRMCQSQNTKNQCCILRSCYRKVFLPILWKAMTRHWTRSDPTFEVCSIRRTYWPPLWKNLTLVQSALLPLKFDVDLKLKKLWNFWRGFWRMTNTNSLEKDKRLEKI